MRAHSVAFVRAAPCAVALAVVLAGVLAGCTAQVLEARSHFVEDGVALAAPGPWGGERVVVDSAGVTPTGGLSLTAGGSDPVRSTARMVAIADTSDKPSADAAIDAVKSSAYAITTDAGVTTVRCGTVGPMGSVAAGEAGCDTLAVDLPSGTGDLPLSVTARSGHGAVVGSFGSATLSNLEVRGSGGAIQITAAATPNATILIVAETGDEVVLRLPADFATDALALEAPPGAIDTTAFPDLPPTPTARGEAGQGAKSITVRAGRIVLAPAP